MIPEANAISYIKAHTKISSSWMKCIYFDISNFKIKIFKYLKFIDQILRSMDSNIPCLAVLTDLSKAFDKVDQKLLFSKL